MSQADNPTPYGPEDALRDVDLARDEIVTRGATPGWYHPVLGTGLGLVLLAFGLDWPEPAQLAVLVGFVLVLGAVLGAYTRRSGMRFGLGQTTRTGGTILASLVVGLILCTALVLSGRETGQVGLVLAGAVLAPVLYTVIGRAYDRQVFRDIRAGRVDAPTPTRLGR